MITTLGRRETSLRLPVIDKMQDIAVDLETRDPDLKTKAPGWVHGNGHICGICISAKEGSFYIPIGHEQGENFDQSVAMKWLQDLMLAPDFDAVFHNAHYDVGWLTQQYGIKITRRIVDTMLAAPLLDEDRFNYGLDALAKDYIRGSKGKDETILEEEIKKQFEYDYVVDIEKVSIRKKTGGRKSNQELPNFLLRPDRDEYIILSKSKATKTLHFTIKKREMKSYLWKLDGESVREYGEQDARLTLNLWKIFKPMIKAQQLEKVFELECGLIMPLIEMRKVGVKVDVKRAEALKIKYTKIIDENQAILDKIAGHPLSITDKGGDLVKTCTRLKIPYGLTKEGNPSFAEENVPEGYEHFYGPLKTIKKYTKARDVFLTSYLSFCIGDRVHPQFNQLKGDDGGTITGRFSCIAEGSMIELVGERKPIEQVKVGDQVYCYDEEGNIKIAPVLNVFDNGERECVNIKWQSSGTGRIGNTICTPEHLLKTKYKGWLRADELKRYDKVYHLTKTCNNPKGRVHLNGTNKLRQVEEQVIKREYFKADKKDHIHHIDFNKSNNLLSNLKVMTGSEHTSFHTKLAIKEGKLKYDHLWLLENRAIPKYGKENCNYKEYSKEELEKMVHDCKGVITKIPMDFDTFKSKCIDENFNYKEVASKYNQKYIQLTVEKVMNAMEKHKGILYKVRQELNVGFIALRKFCLQNEIEYNHAVCSVKPAGIHRVYDLEVEGHHNFIADELCVHNCTSPNLQNIPVRDPDIGPELRSIFIPEDGEVWLALDYSAQEPRMLVHLAIMMGKAFGFDRCPSALIAMEERFSGRDSDFHTEVAKAVIDQQYAPMINSLEYEELEDYYVNHLADLPWIHTPSNNFYDEYEDANALIKFLYKKFRTPAKAIGLGVMYGRGVASIVEGLRMGGMHLTIPEAQDIKTAVMVAVPFLAMVNTFYENMAKTKGYVTTVLGRRGRFPKYEVLDFSDWKDDSIKKEDKRRKFNVFNTAKEASKFYADEVNKGNEGVNYPQRAAAYTALNKVIQGGSADQAKVAILEVYKAGHIKKLRLMVHDELGLSIKPGVDDPKIFQDIMENCIDLYCQSKCDPSTGRNWYEAK